MKKKHWFVILFLMMLYIPFALSFLPGLRTESSNENRSLASFPVLSVSTLSSFPSGVSAWYEDHSPFRTQLRHAYAEGIYHLFHESYDKRTVIGGQEGDNSSLTWLFYAPDGDENPIYQAQGILQYTEEQKAAMQENMQENKKEMQTEGRALYYFVAPNKENVYSEFLPKRYTRYTENTRTDEITAQMQASGMNYLITCREELIDAKQAYRPYFRQDTHWDLYGGWTGYRKIMRTIQPDVLPYAEEVQFFDTEDVLMDEESSDLVRISGLTQEFRDHDIMTAFHLELDDKIERKSEWVNNMILETACADAPVDQTLLLVGDSFRSDLIPYLEKTYRHCRFMHRDDYDPSVIDDLEPDVIILESAERLFEESAMLELR